jgi:HEAT repeat protein
VDVRRKTIDALARMRTPETTQFVARALDDEVAAVRETAVLALMRLGARAVEARLQDIARQDPSKAVRRVAADAAARLRRE